MEVPTEPTTVQDRRTRAYDFVAPFYEAGASIFSTGVIRRAKASQLDALRAGQRVLYAGVGAAEDAVEAARQDVQVTCLDFSAEMIRQAEQKFQKAGLSAEFICGTALDHQRDDYYDVVVANFFLNCFREAQMAATLKHLATLIRPGGKMLIADVALQEGFGVGKPFAWLYLTLGMVPTWLIGLVPWHPVYDYRDYLAGTGLEPESVEWFRLFRVGPIAYQNLTLSKSTDHVAN